MRKAIKYSKEGIIKVNVITGLFSGKFKIFRLYGTKGKINSIVIIIGKESFFGTRRKKISITKKSKKKKVNINEIDTCTPKISKIFPQKSNIRNKKGR